MVEPVPELLRSRIAKQRFREALARPPARVKITFITLCNQLVKAIPLKGLGWPPPPRSRLLLHNHDTGRPAFPLYLSQFGSNYCLPIFRGLTLKIISVTGAKEVLNLPGTDLLQISN